MKRKKQKTSTRKTKKSKMQSSVSASTTEEMRLLTACDDWLRQGKQVKKDLSSFYKKNQLIDLEKAIQWQEFDQRLGRSIRKIEKSRESLLRMSKYQAVEPEQMINSSSVKKKRTLKNHIETYLFYTVLILILVIIGNFFFNANGKAPKNLSGFAPMVVLTKSMQSVYPKGSLVVAKVTDPKQLKVGEDITFLKDENTTVTHRIVGIRENYKGTGKRGFETKGVDNFLKDEEVVLADNVVGKIVYSNYIFGQTVLWIREHLILTVLVVVLLVIFVDAMFTLFFRKTK